MTPKQLAKTCINCGLQKPITAFLQISGPQGTSYGNICSTCRGSGLGKKIVIPVNEDASSSSSSTGLKIDAKSKIHADLEKKELTDKKKEADKKEREVLDLKNAATEERKELKQTLERKHRNTFLDITKKTSFMDYQSKKPEDKRRGLETQTLNEIMQNTDSAIKEEIKAKTVDLSVSHIDPTQTGSLKYGAEWKKFRTRLGGSAAINTIEQQFKGNPNVGKDALIDFVEENFEDENTPTSPGSRRR
jgi:hypothetical protein